MVQVRCFSKLRISRIYTRGVVKAHGAMAAQTFTKD
jgi:hypothetical protein